MQHVNASFSCIIMFMLICSACHQCNFVNLNNYAARHAELWRLVNVIFQCSISNNSLSVLNFNETFKACYQIIFAKGRFSISFYHRIFVDITLLCNIFKACCQAILVKVIFQCNVPKHLIKHIIFFVNYQCNSVHAKFKCM